MNTSILKKVSIGLLLLLLVMPFIGAMILSAGSSAESKQFDIIQIIGMGFYSAPFVLVSFFSILVGGNFKRKFKENAATIAYDISIVSSVIGSALLLTWGLFSS